MKKSGLALSLTLGLRLLVLYGKKPKSELRLGLMPDPPLQKSNNVSYGCNAITAGFTFTPFMTCDRLSKKSKVLLIAMYVSLRYYAEIKRQRFVRMNINFFFYESTKPLTLPQGSLGMVRPRGGPRSIVLHCFQEHIGVGVTRAGLPYFSWYKIPKREKIYQMSIKYNKRP
jgi:hypothetical protein